MQTANFDKQKFLRPETHMKHRCWMIVFAAVAFALVVIVQFWAKVVTGLSWHVQLRVHPSIAPAPTQANKCDAKLGTLVFLAPQRTRTAWGVERVCLLRHAIRSVHQHFTSKMCAYPIQILVSSDPQLDPEGLDGVYSKEDRQTLRNAAPSTKVVFREVPMYSAEALEPGTTPELVARWSAGEDGAVKGTALGYRAMCRLWSGRLQALPFLREFRYYMRMDDDSHLVQDLEFDPFVRMQERNLQYAWRRDELDWMGAHKAFWQVARQSARAAGKLARQYLNGESFNPLIPHRWIDQERYTGLAPYNNFHVSSMALWNRSEVAQLWTDTNTVHGWFKYRIGDAPYHAVVALMLQDDEWERWPHFHYSHNSNDDSSYPPKTWVAECISG